MVAGCWCADSLHGMKNVHTFGDDCLADSDATGVAQGIAAGDFSPAEATAAALARLDAVEARLRGIAVDDRDRAVRRSGENHFPAGVFRGVPTLIKNNTLCEGLPTGHGSATMPDRRAARNEAFTEQFLGTGVNIIGASTLPAFGLTATTEFVDREPTRNPWDTDYSSGGSSGGSSALVAAGVVPIAHANDGGGSIRIPASVCGLVGLKPSRGRVAQALEMESAPIDLVSNGVVTRTVRDTANFLAAVEQQGPVADLPAIGLVEGPGTRRLRIGVVTDTITDQPLDADTRASVDSAIALLTGLGHDVESVPLPVDQSFVRQFIDYWSLMAFAIDHLGKRTFDPDFDRRRLDTFTRSLSKNFRSSMWRLPATLIGLRRATGRYRVLFDRYDLMMSPTLGHITPKIGYLDPAGDFDEIFARLMQWVAYTPLNNTTGTPAMTLPMGTDRHGLPVGVHFGSDLGQERRLLELAFEIEAAQPFARIQDH